MTLKKHIDTSSMVEEFLKKNEVTQCPDYVKGCDKPLNSTVKYDGNYKLSDVGSVPGVKSRTFDRTKEKEHIKGICRACKKHSKFYVSDWRKSKKNRKRYSTLCEECSSLSGDITTLMSSFKTVEEYDDFISRHGRNGNYSKCTLKELKVLLVEAQNHSTRHTKIINKLIDTGKYVDEDVEENKQNLMEKGVDKNNISPLGYEFDF